MSDTGKFKSSKEAAQINAGALSGAAAGGLRAATLHFHKLSKNIIRKLKNASTFG